MISLSAQQNGPPDTAALQIALPPEVPLDRLLVTLNGADVHSRFSKVDCPATCMTGQLSSADGLHPGKNVMYAYVKTPDGHVLSGGYRFDLSAPMLLRSIASRSSVNGWADQAVSGDGGSNFLPPTVAFKTLNAGGWKGQGQPWIQVGLQTYPSASASFCGGLYEVVVLDRQTLAERTSAPESSPFCANSASALSTYLKGLNATDLAIAGTLWTKNPDASLNTSAIGGTDHTKDKLYPIGYIAIGAGGTASGTA